MKSHEQYIGQKLSKRKSENAFRELKNNADSIDFCSNDYLGFASEKEIHYVDNVVKYGSTGSRLISGNSKEIVEVEEYLANFYQADSGLIFNSGYNANVGLFSCIAKRTDTIIYDELVHASIRDGIRLSNAYSFSFEHNNIQSLKEKLHLAKGNIFVAVESIYSMDGDASPLVDLTEICKKNDAALIVDEAHAAGLFGENGEGLVVQRKIQDEVFARVVTFGKAFGGHGAIVLTTKLLRDYLINYSRPFIYTTALPLNTVLAIRKAHQFLEHNFDRVEGLRVLIEYFNNLVDSCKLSNNKSNSSIQCIVVPGNDAVKTLAKKLQRKGFDIRPILSPTVPKGQERLRICLHSYNTKRQISDLVELIEEEL